MSNPRLVVYAMLVLLSLALYPAFAQESKSAAILRHYQRAEMALSKGQAEIAEEEFSAILALDPNNAQGSANLGVIAFKRNDFVKAKSLFETALKNNPTLWDAKALLGLCQMRLGDTEHGLPVLEESFSRIHNPDVKLDAGVAIITAHQLTKTLPAALAVVQGLQQAFPNNPEVLYVSYRAYSELASQQLETLAKSAPDSARTYQVFGEASMTQDDFVKAIAQFRKAIELNPDLPGIHYQLGVAELTNAQDASSRERALSEFETELRRDPSDFHSEYQLAEVYRMEGQLQNAQEHYLKALHLQPTLAEAELGLGVVLAQAGKEPESTEHFLAATRLDPDNEQAHYRLAKNYRSGGRVADADRELAIFQKLHRMHEVTTSPSGNLSHDNIVTPDNQHSER